MTKPLMVLPLAPVVRVIPSVLAPAEVPLSSTIGLLTKSGSVEASSVTNPAIVGKADSAEIVYAPFMVGMPMLK